MHRLLKLTLTLVGSAALLLAAGAAWLFFYSGDLPDSRHLGDFAHYEEGLEALRKGPWAYLLDGLMNEHEEVRAWTAYAEGRNDEALRLLRSVADRQDKVGKAEVEIPAREMLADMLLEMNRPKDALTEYAISLKTDPNRFNGLYGAAQAAEKLQQKEKAAGYYAQLVKNCQGVNSDRLELEQAKTVAAMK